MRDEIQRTHYDVALAVAIKDAEREVVKAAEWWYDKQTVGARVELDKAVIALRAVRGGQHPCR